ncbi:uncharacterized protein LOC141902202 [Tubulanus polymorphus]|uniref:uncharacterized protein LOC141902202 n=1 Tax=Tubulanus polymorphus TaxID=672921 RepID=UPI003DA22362
MYGKKCLAGIVVSFLMWTGINGQQQNCIDAADTTLTTVATPAVVKLGGTTVVLCQVSPPGKHFCGFRITISGQSGQFRFDKTNCPRGTMTGYTGQCDVTAGRYVPATKLTNVKKPADYVLVNDNQQIECKTDSSNPAVQIQWFIYSSTTWTALVSQPTTSQTSAAYHGFMATSALSITATKSMNRAQYRCQTGNLYKDTTITVHFPPESMTLTEIPNGPVVEGTSKTLTCTTDSSNPVSTIMWAYSSGTTTWTDISPNPAVHHKPGSHSGQTSTCNLVVSTDKDKNGRQYRCTAYQNSQPVNGVTKSMTLSILYAPQLSSQVEPIAANIGESIRFTINFDANPQATTLDCSPDSTNGKRLMKNTGSKQWDVIIQSVQASDYGSYSCKLNNSVGSAEITLKLTETGTPQTPSNLSVIAKTAVSVTLSWVSEFKGGAKQTFTVSYRISDSTQFVNKAEISDPGYRKLVQTKITGLKPATDYQFKVKSVNSNPGDNTSPFTDVVTTRTNGKI